MSKLSEDILKVRDIYFNRYSFNLNFKTRIYELIADNSSLYNLFKLAIVIKIPNLINTGSPVCDYFSSSSEEDQKELFDLCLKLEKLRAFE